MQVDDKIRELLEDNKAQFADIKKTSKPNAEMQTLAARNTKAISLLPKPCSECGGSGWKERKLRDSENAWIPCPACKTKKQGSRRPEQQLNKPPVGEIEVEALVVGRVVKMPLSELMDEHQNLSDPVSWYIGVWGTHLEAQAKQIKELEGENRWIPVSEISQKIDGWVEFINPSMEYGNIGGICLGTCSNIQHIKDNYTYWKPIILPKP